MAVANSRDPSLSQATAKATAEFHRAPAPDWSDSMDPAAGDVPPLFEDLLDADTGEDEAEDYASSDLLEAVDMDEVEEDSTFPLTQSRPSSASGTPVPIDRDLYEKCKRAAARLNIPWPTALDAQEGERDFYDGKWLPPAQSPLKQFLPAVPACMKEMGRFWLSPLKSKLPVQGYSKLEIHGMKELGLAGPPAVEPSVAYHLHPNRHAISASSTIPLPNKMERVTASIFQRTYKYAAQTVCILNTETLLAGYQGELLEEMGRQIDAGTPNPALWNEICVVNDLILRSARGAVQGCGHVMGLAVAGERGLWLNHSSLTDTQKADVMDAPYDPTKGLFGSALEKMKETSSLRKLEGEAFELCLPRKQPPRPAQTQKPRAAAASEARAHSAGPRPQKPAGQQKEQQRSGNLKPWGKHSFAAAAAKNRSSHPGDGKKKRTT